MQGVNASDVYKKLSTPPLCLWRSDKLSLPSVMIFQHIAMPKMLFHITGINICLVISFYPVKEVNHHLHDSKVSVSLSPHDYLADLESRVLQWTWQQHSAVLLFQSGFELIKIPVSLATSSRLSNVVWPYQIIVLDNVGCIHWCDSIPGQTLSLVDFQPLFKCLHNSQHCVQFKKSSLYDKISKV